MFLRSLDGKRVVNLNQIKSIEIVASTRIEVDGNIVIATGEPETITDLYHQILRVLESKDYGIGLVSLCSDDDYHGKRPYEMTKIF